MRVITGGFEALSPFVIAGFNSLQLIAKNECRPFSATRQGLNPGEGAAMLVLESKESALARNAQPLARITGFGSALDAYHHTAAHPEGQGLAAAITGALQSAGLTHHTIDHVHLHGTGTQVNDSAEYHAMKKVFAERLPRIPVCSTKSMTGHTFGASGAINAVFACISLRENCVPGTLFCDDRDPAFADLNIAPLPVTTGPLSNIVSTSLGFGGEAFALIISKVDTP
jgi:3-oxoacyl-[acyl-carrier-protein] synthase II